MVAGCGVLLPSRQVSVDPRTTVSGVDGNTVVVTIAAPLSTRIDRPAGETSEGFTRTVVSGRSHPSVSVTRTATNIRRQVIRSLLRASARFANAGPRRSGGRDREW